MWIFVCCVALGVLAIAASLATLRSVTVALQAGDPGGPARAAGMLRVMLWGTVVASLLAAFVVARLSLAVRRADQYPLPGARLLQDTVVRRGPAAARFAHAGFVVAALLVLAAFTLAWSGLRMLGMLAAAAPG